MAITSRLALAASPEATARSEQKALSPHCSAARHARPRRATSRAGSQAHTVRSVSVGRELNDAVVSSDSNDAVGASDSMVTVHTATTAKFEVGKLAWRGQTSARGFAISLLKISRLTSLHRRDALVIGVAEVLKLGHVGRVEGAASKDARVERGELVNLAPLVCCGDAAAL